MLERLAKQALKRNDKSSNAGSDSKVALDGKIGGSSASPKEPEVASIEKGHAGGIHKTVKPCAQCGVITHRKCAGCRISHYCSCDCQRATYAEDKAECAALCAKKKEAKAQRAAAKASKIASEEG